MTALLSLIEVELDFYVPREAVQALSDPEPQIISLAKVQFIGIPSSVYEMGQ